MPAAAVALSLSLCFQPEKSMKILIIEDEKISRIALTNTLRKEGFEAASASTAEEGLALFEKDRHAVVVTDLRLPKADGMAVLNTVMAKSPDTRVIIITAYATVETAIAALKLGAYDYLTKPFSPERLLSILRNIRRLMDVVDENRELKTRLRVFEERPLIGVSPAMQRLVERIQLIARSESTILIEGESGTGKEVAARAVHLASPRRNAPFVVVSSAGIPESLLESELFGHERGAFTGAVRQHKGYVERAQHGTLFIDDIDDLSLSMQVKLLRVLQEREIVRVGGSENISVDVRVIAATKVDLRERVAAKEFREDLYYRLNILPLHIPPLRERREDIPLLIEHFLTKHGGGEMRESMTEEIIAACVNHTWPGNVRELENCVERLVALSRAGHFDITTLGFSPVPSAPAQSTGTVKDYPPFDEYIHQCEQEIIGWAMQRSDNNVSEAARLLRIPRTTLTSKLLRLQK
jgi:two-component system, NtrC family, response regulator AtoC